MNWPAAHRPIAPKVSSKKYFLLNIFSKLLPYAVFSWNEQAYEKVCNGYNKPSGGGGVSSIFLDYTAINKYR